MSRPLKLMVVSNDMLIGGVQRNILGYFRGLDFERFEPHLALVCAGGPLVEPLRELGVDVHVVRSISKAGPLKWIRPGRVIELARLIERLEIDVVQTRLFLGNTIGRLAAARAGVPVVVAAEHSTYYDKTVVHKAIDRRLAEHCQRIVAVSQTVKDFTINQESLPPELLTVIYNGLEIELYRNTRPREQVRAELGIDQQRPVLFSAARLIPEKGYAGFIHALALLGMRVPDVLFVLAGEGPEREHIERQALRKGVSDQLMMLGERNDVHDLLAASDLFVLPSRREGLPTAVIEALAAGCPAVCHYLPQSAEVVDQDVDGLLLDFDDHRTVAETIAALLADPDRRHAMSKRGRAKVGESFTLQRMVGGYMDLYEELWKKANKSAEPLRGQPPQPPL
ncbi:MAG: glycosyltransferase [Candidatus Alcyoniella australis]|nr:glycosyltransferase [Candidatus Alcyoniella australis]